VVAKREVVPAAGCALARLREPGDDYVLIDPIKVTLLTPGLAMDGSMGKLGIPAAVLSKFLWGRGITVEKTNLYSVLFLFSMGITKGKWSTLVTELLAFKELYDRNAPLSQALPTLAADYPNAYAGWGLRDLCDALHAFNQNSAGQGDARDVRGSADAGDDPGRCLQPPGEGRDRAGRHRADQWPHRGDHAGAVPAGHPDHHAGRAFRRQRRADHPVAAHRPRAERRFPGFESDVHGLIIEQEGMWFRTRWRC
jgi:arginine decarboxylase